VHPHPNRMVPAYVFWSLKFSCCPVWCKSHLWWSWPVRMTSAVKCIHFTPSFCWWCVLLPNPLTAGNPLSKSPDGTVHTNATAPSCLDWGSQLRTFREDILYALHSAGWALYTTSFTCSQCSRFIATQKKTLLECKSYTLILLLYSQQHWS
jgi:hypothetical protein